MAELWIATGNQGKLNEFKMLFNRVPIEIHSQAELPVFAPPPENGDSFLANARIKARALKALKSKQWALGDDSGLEVAGLNNLPGIHSARYAGPKASDSENTAKLLKMMQLKAMSSRAAQFRCVLVAYDPQGQEHIFEGFLKGEIAKAPKGTTGFGYDNVFIPEGQTQTLAELGLAYKNRASHRALAANQMIALLESSLGGEGLESKT
ncbi:MAG: RdgB/HAM1 family non-canonical purine NTP pyrophosphatase [Bdellovibrionaceae bacterium]|nr:RdgB/HAM1 family non-canonical purine NTP pyrophosphatase [Pseudobdellovibrionaceae bacterium]